jgi:phosphoribosylformylglycinamidine synthase
VSLYNETTGVGILPTPAIGGVGLVKNVDFFARAAFLRENDVVLLIGGAPGWIGRSAWLQVCEGREEGAPPPVDLEVERRNGESVLKLIESGALDSVHDVSDGGLAVALAEMAIAGNRGAKIEARAVSGLAHAFFFGEDSGRYVVAAPRATAERLIANAARAGVPALRLGVTGGSTLALSGEEPIAIAELRAAFESWLPAYMEGFRS